MLAPWNKPYLGRPVSAPLTLSLPRWVTAFLDAFCRHDVFWTTKGKPKQQSAGNGDGNGYKAEEQGDQQ